MDELEKGGTPKQAAQKIPLYEKFIKGYFGLAKTYWVFGVLVTVISNLAIRAVPSDTIAYFIGAILVTYQFALLIATWNAAKNYSGPKIWSILAVLIIFLSLSRNVRTVLSM